MKSTSLLVFTLVFVALGCQSAEDKALAEFEVQSDRMDVLATDYPSLGPCLRKIQRDREGNFTLAMRQEGEERLNRLLALNQQTGNLVNRLDSLPVRRKEFVQLLDSLVSQQNLPFRDYDRLRKAEEEMDWAWRVLMEEGVRGRDCEQTLEEHYQRAVGALQVAQELGAIE
ncbi:MAG TPA: hypothetical protein DCE41_08155 [Cytophagales bacterium]|nr:hypothetical protein [Cytophagales bacterium]HAA18543.1 hypothetical protein [Cytophagales bacterium]HAP62933.1 hypothetical protein [Cytophagales bacterium]